MNQQHLTLCASAEWADAVKRWIIPWVLDGVEIGEDVLEVGPGPGLTTDVLCSLTTRLTAVELDPDLAAALATRTADANVEVICADATATELPTGRFSTAVCLTMLHHLPSARHQASLYAEMHRVLRPGGLFVGQDSLDDPEFRALHDGDICVPVDPALLDERLRTAGFPDVTVDVNDYAVRFRARKHPAPPSVADPGPSSR